MTLYVNNGTALWPGFALRLGRPSELTRITLRRAAQQVGHRVKPAAASGLRPRVSTASGCYHENNGLRRNGSFWH
jgi:hypothetical protein